VENDYYMYRPLKTVLAAWLKIVKDLAKINVLTLCCGEDVF